MPNREDGNLSGPVAPRTRLAVFGSFYRGYHVLQEMLHGPISRFADVVGVATDDPSAGFVSPQKRVWQYPHEPWEQTMVADYARQWGLPVYQSKVKTPAFYEIMENEWKPDVCIMATFGQRIDERLFQYPRLGFFNLHPCTEDRWPSRYVGGNPFDALMNDGVDYAVIALHKVDAGFDTGALVAYSERFYFPKGATVTQMHKLTAQAAARLAAREIGCLLQEDIKKAPDRARAIPLTSDFSA
jgi:methionyl-tRNA formyltransferase